MVRKKVFISFDYDNNRSYSYLLKALAVIKLFVLLPKSALVVFESK